MPAGGAGATWRGADLILPSSLGALIASDGIALYALALLYTILAAYVARRSCAMRGRGLSPPRVFAASVGAAAVLRAASFVSCTVLALDPAARGGGGAPGGAPGGAGAPGASSRTARVLQVLFNSGDWAAINCYALLLLVWLELLLRTRAHVFPSRTIARDWRRALGVIAAVVQIAQAGLYAAAFSTPEATATRVLISIYVTIAVFNVALPALFAVGATLSFFLYAGFPFRSASEAAAFRRASLLVAGWTAGRLAWAVLALFCANDGLATASAAAGTWFFPVLSVTVFAAAELLPFFAALGSDSLRALGLLADEDARADGAAPSAGSGAAGASGGSGGGEGGGGGGGGNGALLGGSLNAALLGGAGAIAQPRGGFSSVLGGGVLGSVDEGGEEG